MLIPCQTIPYFDTLRNYALSYYITELYPILIHCRTIFSQSLEEQQYPHAPYMIADVITVIRLTVGNQKIKKKLKKSYSVEKEATPIFIHTKSYSLC